MDIPTKPEPRKRRLPERWREFRDKKHSLRISVSSIASVTGFHPFKNLPELLMDHIYQGSDGRALLYHDASLLGIQIVSEEESLMEIAKQAGKKTEKALLESMRVKSGAKQLESIDQAARVKQQVVHEAKKSKKLTETQVKQLESAARENAYTGCGKSWEEEALDLYSDTIGWEVTERNSRILSWPFERITTTEGTLTVKEQQSAFPAYEFGCALQSANDESQPTSAENPVDLTESNDDLEVHDFNRQPPYFSLQGVVDGIREELVPSSGVGDDDDSWILTRVVVECKHRMTQLKKEPPLFDMLQAVAYCFMYNTTQADLVQVLRSKKLPENPVSKESAGVRSQKHIDSVTNEDSSQNKITQYFGGKGVTRDKLAKEEPEEVGTLAEPQPQQQQSTDEKDPGKTGVANIDSTSKGGTLMTDSGEGKDPKSIKSEGSAAVDLALSIYRVDVADPIFQHEKHWNNTVLPRLRSWVDAVYSIRGNDDLRYRLLTLTAGEKLDDVWELLFEECPWLRYCDTAYSRQKA